MKLMPYPPAPDRYMVREDGVIFGMIDSQSKPRLSPIPLKPCVDDDGYLHVSLRTKTGCKSRRIAVHRVVCLAFHGDPPSPVHEVAHADGVPGNNSAANLRWATRRQNAEDRDSHGRTVWGERATRGKLSMTDVTLARQLRASGMSLGGIGRTLNVSAQAIHKITTGASWSRHVNGGGTVEKAE